MALYKIIHGKPRHPESQGSVERANREIKNALGSIMSENTTDLCWVKYLKRVQYQKNTTHHSTIGLTPYEALYNHKPSSGLLDFGIPQEVAHDIHTEQDLECIINSINATAAEDNDSDSVTPTPISADNQPEPELPFSYHEHLLNTSSPSSPVFFTLPDPYLDDISQPIPDGTRIFGQESIYPETMNCVVCGELTSGAYSCPGCRGKTHVFCGRMNGDEG